MLRYVLRRIIFMIPTLLAVSIVTFVIIQLPPGDWLTSYIARLSSTGETVDQATIESLKVRYGLGQPIYMQYLKWMGNVLQGDFGQSFEWNKPVVDLLKEPMALTFVISFLALIIHWITAFPIGVYSAVKQYSVGDYLFTGMAFLGAAIPQFLVALVLMWFVFVKTGTNITGLFSPEYREASWSLGKVLDLLKHAVLPVLILGLLGSAGLIRTMRAMMLDELRKPYVVTGRAKGLKENRVILKYPVRVALNPFVSTVGWSLPGLISGTTIISIVLGLPTTGPILLHSLMSQDMYLAGSFLLLLSFLTILGTLISDILLAWLDPRIRLSD
ncbi:MAG: ABC transporter permease [Anaerolineae bacterium]|jgi:peptide/nickel transport system permease protein